MTDSYSALRQYRSYHAGVLRDALFLSTALQNTSYPSAGRVHLKVVPIHLCVTSGHLQDYFVSSLYSRPVVLILTIVVLCIWLLCQCAHLHARKPKVGKAVLVVVQLPINI
jgi:hypothetical protein